MSPREMILSPRERRLAIVKAVARQHRLSPEDLLGERRMGPIAAARREAMVLIRVYCGDSYERLGEFFDRDHSTVIYNMARYFGYKRPSGSTITGAGEAIDRGMANYRDQLLIEATLYVSIDNEAKHKAREQNPLFGGMSHAA